MNSSHEEMSGKEEAGIASPLGGDELPLSQTMDPIEYKKMERRLRLKMDLQIVPLCLMLYFLSFLDRTNIGQAKLNGLMQDLHLSSWDYTIEIGRAHV